MKEFFKNKVNLLLTVLLICILGVIIYMAYGIFGPEKLVAIDFSRLSIKEIQEWKEVHSVEDEKLVLKYEYSEDVLKDYVIYQSIKPNEVIEDKIEIIISNGFDPDLQVELPNLDEIKTLEAIEEWFSDNHFSDVTYEYVLDKDLEKDYIVRLNKEGIVKRSDAILVYLSAGSDSDSNNMMITVPDFKYYSKAEIDAWAKANRMNVKYNYAISTSYKEGAIIEQDVKEQSEVSVGTKITITISSGEGVTMADFDGKSKSDVSSWASQNGIYVNYIENYHSSYKKGLVYQTTPKANTLIAKGSTIDVYLSKGKESDDYVKVDDSHLGESEADFLKYIQSLGLSASKDNVTNYSTTLKKGTIYWYDDGSFKKGSVIGYGLSEGPYIVDLNKFNKATKTDAEKIVKEANNRNAHLTLKTVETETDAYKEGVLFDCSETSSGKNITITCKIAKNTTAVVPPVEEPPIQEPQTVYLKNYVGSSSPCSSDSCSVGDINFTITYDYSDSYAKGIVMSQSVASGNVEKGSSVALVVSLGEKMAYVPSIDVLDTKAVDGYDAASSFIANTLKDFKNVTITSAESEYAVGRIVSVKVGGDSAYTPGNYPISTEIIVVLSSKQIN